jgi:hypothetical protein
MEKKETQVLLILIGSTIAFSLLQCIRNKYFNGASIVFSYNDYYYYTTTAEKMRLYGIEARDFEQGVSGMGFSRTPYHYFDLWMNAFFQEFLPVSKTFIYLYVCIPMGAALSFLSLASIFRLKNSNIVIGALISFLAVFYFGVIPFKGGGFFSNAIILPKIFPSLVFASLCFCLMYQRKYESAVISLSILPIMNLLALPTVISSVGIWCIYLFFTKKRKEAFGYLALSLLPLLFLGLYFHFLGSGSGKGYAGSISLMPLIKNFVHVLFIDNLLRVWMYVIPFILLVIALWRNIKAEYQQNSSVYILFVPLFLLGFFWMSLINFSLDSWQIIFFPASAVLSIFVVHFLSLYPRGQGDGNKMKLLAAGLMIAQIFYAFLISFTDKYTFVKNNSISRTYFTEVNEKLADGSTGALLYDPGIYKLNIWAKNPFVLQSGYYLGLEPKKLDLFVLSLPVTDGQIDNDCLEALRMSEFQKYVARNAAADKTLDDYQYGFITERKLGFIICPQSVVLGNKVRSLVHQVIKDDRSENQLVLLENGKN